MSTLFELVDFAPPAPTWAVECFYCTPDSTGYYDEATHLRHHLPLTCQICSAVSPNRLLFENSHGVCLGSSWGKGYLLCTSLSLQLNHLAYDLLHGTSPHASDQPALDLGWRIAPDGAAIAPEGWPAAPLRCASEIANQSPDFINLMWSGSMIESVKEKSA